MESLTACVQRYYSSLAACEVTLKVKDVLSSNYTSFNVANSTPCETWVLCVYRKNIEVELTCSNENVKQAFYCLSIIESDGVKRYIPNEEMMKLEDINRFENNSVAKIKRQELLDNPKLLHDGELWLHCEIITEGQYEVPTFDMIADKLKFRLPVNGNEEDLTAFVAEIEQFVDVTIVVGGKEIKAHKVFLAMSSPVFAAMFECEMEEQKKNRVVISDMDYQVVEQMLLYMYTGKAPKLDELADQLLIAAEKYSLDTLKVLCEQQLSSTISMETVIRLMALADLHNAHRLKDKLNEFTTEHIEELMETTSWQTMIFESLGKLPQQVEAVNIDS